MSIAPGARIGPFDVLSLLGAGGMGQVYRARDSRLNRDVAIKVLPPEFAGDPDRMARFSREAQMLAALSHPNIAAIYGLEEAGGTSALVMELVEGQTLAERIGAGRIPIDEAVAIARQIAEALEAAHEKGIVHRDLKPANVKIDPEGKVKVLDFGLAKAMDPDPASGSPANSPTLTIASTRAGEILGTAAYMSPEQARGKSVDKRADIWAFGLVLYEMLSGRSMFAADTVAETLASVLRAEIDLAGLPSNTPPGVRLLIQRCLERDPKQRLRDIGEARIALDAPGQPATVPAVAAPKRAYVLPWAVAAALAVLAAAVGAVHYREQASPAPLVRFHVPVPEKNAFNTWLALSPDGRNLAFSATGVDGTLRVWVRSLESLESRPIATGEGSSTVTMFWSPDSRTVVFQAAGKIRKAAVAGGPAQTICAAPPVMLGGSWNQAGTILFGSNAGPIMRVSSAGGTVSPVTQVDGAKGETNHSDPIFLPDGNHFLYFRHVTKQGEQGIYLGSLEAKPGEQPLRRIESVDFSPAYVPAVAGSSTGYLLFMRENSLLARPFDQQRFEPVGEPVPIAEGIGTSISRAFFSASNNGVLAYRQGSGPAMQMAWYDREGQVRGMAPPGPLYQDVALSPDGSRVAFSAVVQGGLRQIWLMDLSRNLQTRFTFLSEPVRSPVWSPDGRRLAFTASATGRILVKNGDGGGDTDVVLSALGSYPILTDWSRDGGFLIFSYGANSYDLWALPTGGDRKPFVLANSEFAETHGQVSPDSRWLAYDSNETGRAEVYVRPFPPEGRLSGKWAVSISGGFQPRWRDDGKELFFVAPDRSLMAVDVKTGPVFQAETPRALFQIAAVNLADLSFKYDVSKDGKKFVVVAPSREGQSTPATIVLNWQNLLKR